MFYLFFFIFSSSKIAGKSTTTAVNNNAIHCRMQWYNAIVEDYSPNTISSQWSLLRDFAFFIMLPRRPRRWNTAARPAFFVFTLTSSETWVEWSWSALWNWNNTKNCEGWNIKSNHGLMSSVFQIKVNDHKILHYNIRLGSDEGSIAGDLFSNCGRQYIRNFWKLHSARCVAIAITMTHSSASMLKMKVHLHPKF